MWAYKNRWKESNSQVIHNVQSLMPRPWSPFKTWRSTFFCWALYYLDYYDYGVLQKQGCPLSQFCLFLFRPLFSLLHFLSCPDILFQIGFPFHNCETKPYAPHTQNQNEQTKAKDSGENPGPKHSWESRIPIVFLFVLGCDFDRFFL